MDVVQELANQLGVATEYVLGEYVPFYIGLLIGDTILAFIFVIVGIIVAAKSMKADMNNHHGEDVVRWHKVVCIISISFTVLGIIGLVFNVPYLIGAINSPTGAAINHIIFLAS